MHGAPRLGNQRWLEDVESPELKRFQRRDKQGVPSIFDLSIQANHRK